MRRAWRPAAQIGPKEAFVLDTVADSHQNGYSITAIPEEEKSMKAKRVVIGAVICTAQCLAIAWVMRAQQKPAAAPAKIYNTAKLKLMQGKPIFGVTIESPDPNIYCAAANSGYDFTWIEMQHSTLTYADAARMIWACRGAKATPFLRVPDATESDIQKATDIGVLGVIVPTVDTVEKAEAAVKWSKYPPVGRRSMGGGQHKSLYGDDYRQTANDNMIVVIMIETPIGVANAEKIAAVPGIDVIFAASGDLGNFSGHKQGEPEYEALVTRIHDVTLKAGIKLGGPQMWKNRPDYTFFQAPPEWMLIQEGARVNLGTPPSK
jgi:2-keto-3-deoxy-L-rhamnonate aldolase RhmA